MGKVLKLKTTANIVKKALKTKVKAKHILACCKLSKGKDAIKHLQNASADEIESFPSTSRAFHKYLQHKRGAATSKGYVLSFGKLFRIHRKSLVAMASGDYVDAVRVMGLPFTYAACAKAFLEFGQRKISKEVKATPEKRLADASTYGTARKMWRISRESKSLAHLTDASDTDMDAFSPILADFKQHLAATFPDATAVQYYQVFRRLVYVHRKTPLVMASMEYFDAVQNIGLRASQISAVKAFCGFKGVDVARDPGSMRQKANVEARKRLMLAERAGRSISDGDVLAVLRLWGFKPNTQRLNVLPKGVSSVFSATLGLIKDRRGRSVVSSSTGGSEDVMRLMCQWLKGQIGIVAFPFTSISINKGYAAARHRDKGNAGPSAARAIGDFQGGHLRYWHGTASNAELEGLSNADSVVLDTRNEVALFDGNYPHSVEEYTGERFSAVFFTSGSYHLASSDVRAKVSRLGGVWPTQKGLSGARAVVVETMEQVAA